MKVIIYYYFCKLILLNNNIKSFTARGQKGGKKVENGNLVQHISVSTRFPLLTQLYAGYRVNLIYIIFTFLSSGTKVGTKKCGVGFCY